MAKNKNKDFDLFIEAVLKEHREASQSAFKETEAVLKGHFKDLHEQLPKAMKAAGMQQDKKMEKAVTKLVDNWQDAKPGDYKPLEDFGKKLHEAIKKNGFDYNDVHRRLSNVLGLPEESFLASGFGAGSYGRILEKQRKINLTSKDKK